VLRLHTRIEKLYFEDVLGDFPVLPDQLIQTNAVTEVVARYGSVDVLVSDAVLTISSDANRRKCL
jgi:hypothetical protein